MQTILNQSDDIVDLFDKAKNVQSQNRSESRVHGVQHIRNVLLLSNYLGKQNGINGKDLEMLREAAIYHDICHQKSGDKEHAKQGADFYLEKVDNSDFNSQQKEEIAFLIEAHEISGISDIEKVLNNKFSNISEERKKELISLATILQDADRLDMLRYDIKEKGWQRFDPNSLYNPENKKLISAVIELNTRQAIETGILHEEDFEEPDINNDLLKLYFDSQTTFMDIDSAKPLLNPNQKEQLQQIERNN